MQVDIDTHGRSAAMTEHAVAIAGGGPAGMMLAAELALAGVDVALLESRCGRGISWRAMADGA